MPGKRIRANDLRRLFQPRRPDCYLPRFRNRHALSPGTGRSETLPHCFLSKTEEA